MTVLSPMQPVPPAGTRQMTGEVSDRALRDARPTTEYRGFVERWLGPELRGEYRRAFEAELSSEGTASAP